MTPDWGLINLIAQKVARREVVIQQRTARRGSCDFEDFAQEARIAMWRAYERHDAAVGPLDRFLMTVAKRRMIDLRRCPPFGLVGMPADGVCVWNDIPVIPAPDAGPDHLDAALTAAATLAHVPPPARVVFAMVTQGYSLGACARQLKIPPMRANRLFHHCVRTLQRVAA